MRPLLLLKLGEEQGDLIGHPLHLLTLCDSRVCSPLSLSLGGPGAWELGRGVSAGHSRVCLVGSWALCANTQGTTAVAATVQVVQAGELDAERLTEGSRKGQDKGPFVSMETAPQGEGLKKEKAPTSPPSEPGKWHPSWLGSPLPLPPLPGVLHGNPPSKREVQSCIWCWGAREPRGNKTGPAALP